MHGQPLLWATPRASRRSRARPRASKRSGMMRAPSASIPPAGRTRLEHRGALSAFKRAAARQPLVVEDMESRRTPGETIVFFGAVDMAGNRSHHLAQRGFQILFGHDSGVLSIRSTHLGLSSTALQAQARSDRSEPRLFSSRSSDLRASASRVRTPLHVVPQWASHDLGPP